MSAETASSVKPWRRRIAFALVAVVVLAWIVAAIVAIAFEAREVRVGALLGAALVTEGALWGGAALVGVSVVQARKQIWRRLTGRAAKS